jgi:hypothetical protein
VAEKLDLFKQHKAEYAQPKTPALVTTTSGKYLSISGAGSPGDATFQSHIGALYAVAFTIKMTRKFARLGDYRVCPLEGLWWDASGDDVTARPTGPMNWTLLIRVPDAIRARDLKDAVGALRGKGKTEPVSEVRLVKLHERRCVQMLHVGPYRQEPETIARMTDYVRAQGLSLRGRHHEIYLSDPRRVPAARLRTILRLPVSGRA